MEATAQGRGRVKPHRATAKVWRVIGIPTGSGTEICEHTAITAVNTAVRVSAAVRRLSLALDDVIGVTFFFAMLLFASDALFIRIFFGNNLCRALFNEFERAADITYVKGGGSVSHFAIESPCALPVELEFYLA